MTYRGVATPYNNSVGQVIFNAGAPDNLHHKISRYVRPDRHFLVQLLMALFELFHCSLQQPHVRPTHMNLH